MRFFRWCGQVAIAFMEWAVVFVILADLSAVLPWGPHWFLLRVWGTVLGSVVATAWLRRRLRARRGLTVARETGRKEATQ